MPQARPKILTRFTVPTGGYVFKWYAEFGNVGETAITATVPAGDYYMADDQQANCFLWALSNAAITASKAAGYDEGPVLWIDDNFKVNIGFEGDDYHGGDQQDVSIAWTEEDGAAIAAILGFDSSADDTSLNVDNAVFTGDYHHAYGWYADDDGWISGDQVEDIDVPMTLQSRAISGHVKSQFMGSMYDNFLDLEWVTRNRMYSSGADYGSSVSHPYERNKGLECWFREAKKGTPFRVYRHHRRTQALAEDRGSSSFVGADAVTYTDASKSWNTEPKEWVGGLLRLPAGSAGYLYRLSAPVTWYIEDNTDNDITVNAHPTGYLFNSNNDPTSYQLHHIGYGTYVLDMSSPVRFAPTEIPNIDHYNFSVKLLRYVS